MGDFLCDQLFKSGIVKQVCDEKCLLLLYGKLVCQGVGKVGVKGGKFVGECLCDQVEIDLVCVYVMCVQIEVVECKWVEQEVVEQVWI